MTVPEPVSAPVNGIRADDLRLIMEAATGHVPIADLPRVNEALKRCGEALNGKAKDGTGESAMPSYPPGEFARVELPGYVAWTGWVAEETFAGAGVLVVRDIGGTVQARVSAGAFRQVIPLGLPRPGETAVATAIEAGGDAWADDRDEEPF